MISGPIIDGLAGLVNATRTG